jgi:hypothetical protein
MKPAVTIAILNARGRRFCSSSIGRSRRFLPLEVLVVDNGSTDGGDRMVVENILGAPRAARKPRCGRETSGSPREATSS